MADTNVKVICRFRPVNEREKQEGDRSDTPQLEFPDDQTVIVKIPKQKPSVYQFDRVFSNPTVKQEDIYNLSAKVTIDDIFEGYNGTIFAYGQTGSGKSFTMFGPDSSDDVLKGIIPRACEHIFDKISNHQANTEFLIKCSFLEIYKESIRDLLDPTRVNLKVRETPARGVWVQDLTEHFVASDDDIYDLLQLGEKSRATSSTKMNAVSSRSHSLFILTLSQKNIDGSTKEGKLNLADLAGSEKVGKTGATGDTLEEAKKINQSLSALGNCINALTKTKGHIPYRDSRLTHILRESLGGNSKTTLIIACSPHSFNVEETISTLKFGQRAKSIKNKVKVNQQRSVKELEGIIDNLSKDLSNLKCYIGLLEEALLGLDNSFDLESFKNNILSQLNVHRAKESNDNDQNVDNSDENYNADTSFDYGMISNELLGDYNPMAVAEFKVKLQQMKEEYELGLQDLKDEIETLEQQKREYDENSLKWDDLKLEAERYKKEMKEIKHLMASKDEEERIFKEKLEYENQIKENKEKMQSLKSKREELDKRHQELNEKNAQLLHEKELEIEKKVVLSNQLSSLKDNLHSLYQVVSEKQSQIESLKKENSISVERNKKSDESIEALNQEIQSLQTNVESIRKSILETEKKLEEQSNNLNQVDDSSIPGDETLDDRSSLKKEFSEAKKKFIYLSSDLLRKEDEQNDLKEQLTYIKKKNIQAEEILNNLNESLEQMKFEEEERESRLNKHLKSLEDKLKMETRLKENAISEAKKTELKIEDRKKKLKSSVDLLEKNQNESNSMNQEMSNYLSQAQERIAQLESQLESLHDEYERSNAEKNEAESLYHQFIYNLTSDPVQHQSNETKVHYKQKRKDSRHTSKNVIVPIKGGQPDMYTTPSHEQKKVMGLFKKTVLPSTDELGEPVKTGELWKLSGIFKAWGKKLFFLKGHNLYCFDSKTALRPVEYYDVSQCNVVAIKKKEEFDKYPFCIDHPQRKQVLLCAESEEERDSWVKTIESIIKLEEKEGSKN